jgi:hypothetical protein
MLDQIKGGIGTIIVSVVGTLIATGIIFYAGALYQADIPISAGLNIVTVPNPLSSKVVGDRFVSPPKEIADLIKTLPTQFQGMATIFNLLQIGVVEVKNNGDSRSEGLELFLPTNSVAEFYIDPNKPTLSLANSLKLGTLNPCETMHVAVVGPSLLS